MTSSANADEVPIPILRLDAGGHSSYVSALAWHPNGKEFYSSSWDKSVRVWRVNDAGKFLAQPAETIRVPIGRGPQGKIDTLAVSSDGRWLALGGYATLIKQAAGFGSKESDFRAVSSVELLEQGVIYVLDRRNNKFTRLLGHRGPVRQLQFAHSRDGTEHLVSAGFDVDADQKTIGSLRVWDFRAGKQTTGILLPVKPDRRPSLAIFPSPTSESGLQIFAGWGNESSYQWDTATQPPEMRTVRDGEYNAVARLPNSMQLISSSGRKQDNAGQIRFWNTQSNGLPTVETSRQIRFPFQNNEVYLPLAFTLLSSVVGGPPDHIAVALCAFRNQGGRISPDRLQLRVVTIPQSSGVSREIARKELWQVEQSGLLVPSLAAVPGGEYLAISGNPNHEIQVYSVDTLLRNRDDSQHLSSATATPDRLAFVRNGDALGLRVSLAGENASIFDLSNSRFSPLPESRWLQDVPAIEGWTATASTTDPRAILAYQAGTLRHTLRIPPRHALSGFVFSAALKETGKPLLLVAAHEDGQPWLAAFDMDDGEMKRVFQAHSEPIRSLAISGDSRLLATASSDQTVAVWDISDTNDLLQPRATLTGVVLLEENGRVKVEALQSEASNTTVLRANDELMGYFDESQPEKLQAWPSITATYLTLSERAAGSQIRVRRLRNGASADVVLTLQQAAQVRMPLFQLMMTRSAAEEPRRWIGWSPLGPYDASDKKIRTRLGWHFNELKPGHPVSFAPIDQYPNLFQKGLIRDSISNLGKTTTRTPLAAQQPRMRLYFIQPQPNHWNTNGLPVTRQKPSAVGLRITNPAFPEELIQLLRLSVDGRRLGRLTPSPLGGWQIDGLEVEAWERGAHLLEAELLTNEAPPRAIVSKLQFEFVPERPTVDALQIPARTTKESRLPLNWQVGAGDPLEPLDVQLMRSGVGGELEVIESWSIREGLSDPREFEREVELSEGENQFVVVARNSDATTATREAESAEIQFSIERIQPDDNPPSFDIAELQQASRTGFEQATKTGVDRWLATEPSIRIVGKVSAEEPVTTATIDGNTIPDFVAAKEYTFTVDADLEPGINRIKFAAKTDFSREVVHELVIEFQKPVPIVEVIRPYNDGVITEELPESGIELKAVFEAVPEQAEFTARLIQNGQPAETVLDVNMSEGTVSGRFSLDFGSNSLQLELKNGSDATRRTSPVVVYYQPRPSIVRQEVPESIDGSSFDAQFFGKAATDIERVLVDGRLLEPEHWSAEREGAQFTLKLKDLIWEGKRTVSVVSIFSAGSSAPVDVVLKIPKRKRRATPPSLAILAPINNSSVTSENVVIDFQVESLSAVFNLEIIHDGQSLKQPIGLDNSFRQQANVRLRPGINRIRLVAENGEGMRSESVTVNYVPSPVAVDLKSLVSSTDPSEEYQLYVGDDGIWGTRERLVTGSNRLTGSVRWSYRDEAALKNSRLQIWVAVNGFKQPVTLQLPAGESLERTFECPIQLFRAGENTIEVTAPDLPELAGIPALASVECETPAIARQRLHLVIIGVGVQPEDEPKLMENAVASLAGSELRDLKNRKEFVFKSSAFSECIGYGPYVGPVVSREKIGSLLEMIRLRIFQFKKLDPANDVMLVYYRGGEQVYDGGQFYLTTQETKSSGEAEILRNPIQLQYFAVSSDSLANFVEHCPGTQLLLLDVARTAMAQVPASSAPDFIPGAATFRYAWLKGQAVPEDARLISAWQASPMATRLDEIERTLAERHQSLARRYRDSVSYENYLPAVLKGLTMGTAR